METVANKTWKPMVAGILEIVGGALSVLGAIGVIIGIMLFLPVYTAAGPGPVPDFGHWLIPGMLETLPVIGGVFALRRKRWGWALAGSIAAVFASTLFGILATIFVAISKDEFE
jgi:hypothetical protein